MHDFEWEEVESENPNYVERQINLTVFYGTLRLGCLCYCGEDIKWTATIEGREEFLEAETEDDAKKEFIEHLITHYEGDISDNTEMLKNLREFNGENVEPKYSKEEIAKAIRHFECMKNDAIVVLDSGFGTKPGESDLVYRNRKLYAEIAIEAISKVFQ